VKSKGKRFDIINDMKISHIDHFVLTVADIDATLRFYTEVLGMSVQRFGTPEKPRVALCFGNQKINLHAADAIPDPNVLKPTSGSADFCLITAESIEAWISHFAKHGVAIIEGPVMRTGATGKIRSIYVRDPDLNLVEIAEYV
jgi:catechol 2,3-dioxygenase-like lactoylglutathione lyase family enzyme